MHTHVNMWWPRLPVRAVGRHLAPRIAPGGVKEQRGPWWLVYPVPCLAAPYQSLLVGSAWDAHVPSPASRHLDGKSCRKPETALGALLVELAPLADQEPIACV